jgi:hypothetical protein
VSESIEVDVGGAADAGAAAAALDAARGFSI